MRHVIRLCKPALVAVLTIVLSVNANLDTRGINFASAAKMSKEAKAQAKADAKAAKQAAKQSAKAEKAAVKAAAKAAKQAAKAAAKAQKTAAKQAAKEAKAAAKAAKKLAKQQAKAEKAAAKAAAKAAKKAAKAAAKAQKAAAKAAKKAAKQQAKAEKAAAKAAAKAAKQAAKAAAKAQKTAAKASIKQAKVEAKAAAKNIVQAAKANIGKVNVPDVLKGKTALQASQNRVIKGIMKSDFRNSPKVKAFLVRRVAFKKHNAQVADLGGGISPTIPAANDNVATGLAAENTQGSDVTSGGTQIAGGGGASPVDVAGVLQMADAGEIPVSDEELLEEYLTLPDNFTEVADNLSDDELANLATAAGGDLDSVKVEDLFGEKGHGLLYAQFGSGFENDDPNKSPINIDHDQQGRRIRTNADGTVEISA